MTPPELEPETRLGLDDEVPAALVNSALGELRMIAHRGIVLFAVLAAAGLSGATDGTNDHPTVEAGTAQKDYAAELPRIPLKDTLRKISVFLSHHIACGAEGG